MYISLVNLWKRKLTNEPFLFLPLYQLWHNKSPLRDLKTIIEAYYLALYPPGAKV